MNISFIQCTIMGPRFRLFDPSDASHGLSHCHFDDQGAREKTVAQPTESRIRCNSRGFFNNTMLIYAQHYSAYTEGLVPNPTPTYVAGFHQWLSLGRHVVKGQHGCAILAPVMARFTSSNPSDASSGHRLVRGEKPGFGETVKSKLIGLKPAHVWDPLFRDIRLFCVWPF